MSLVDELEKREEWTKVLPPFKEGSITYTNDGWGIEFAGVLYLFSEDAWNTLMNKLRIPIKYIERLVTTPKGVEIAKSNISYSLEQATVHFLEENEGTISQVFSDNHLFLPGVRVNDFILDIFESELKVHSYNVDGDLFEAVYLTDNTREVGEDTYKIGVRVLYSDCFAITPRFDGVVYNTQTGAIISHPTVGRKFRVADTSIDQIYEQIAQFTELSVQGALTNLVPALKNKKKHKTEDFLINLCTELRYSKKVKSELEPFTEMESGTAIVLANALSSHVEGNSFTTVTVQMKRDISVALGNFLMNGRFK